MARCPQHRQKEKFKDTKLLQAGYSLSADELQPELRTQYTKLLNRTQYCFSAMGESSATRTFAGNGFWKFAIPWGVPSATATTLVADNVR
jgi:hypothetical protein